MSASASISGAVLSSLLFEQANCSGDQVMNEILISSQVNVQDLLALLSSFFPKLYNFEDG